MLIDRTHRSWALITLLLFLASTAIYIWYAVQWPNGPSGRTWPGMAFGVVGTMLMLFAGLLSARKKTIKIRWGSLSWWLKGHIWLGLLSLPLILYHAAFHWGGTLEKMLWVVLLMVIASGIIGILLQNILPRMMKLQLPNETIPDQLHHVIQALRQEADSVVQDSCGAEAVSLATNPPDILPQSEMDPYGRLMHFYIGTVRPFLGEEKVRKSPLNDSHRAQLIFDRAREKLPHDLGEVVGQLEQKCQQRRQLEIQSRLHGMMHSWLKIHLPLSIVLLLFVVLHIATALYY